MATTEVGSGGRLAPAVRPDDRLLAVLQGSSVGNAAVLIEIGIAIGRGLPILVVATQESTTPAMLTDVFVVRCKTDDSAKLILPLKLFLRSEPHELPPHPAARLHRPDIDRFRGRLDSVVKDNPRRGLEFERLVADLFRQLGAHVEEQSQVPIGGRPDLAIFIPGEEEQLGMVIIELKFGNSIDSLGRAANQLQRFVLEIGSGLGLLLYTGQERPLPTWPMVVALSMDRFLSELEHYGLAEILVRVRNEAIHNL